MSLLFVHNSILSGQNKFEKGVDAHEGMPIMMSTAMSRRGDSWVGRRSFVYEWAGMITSNQPFFFKELTAHIIGQVCRPSIINFGNCVDGRWGVCDNEGSRCAG